MTKLMKPALVNSLAAGVPYRYLGNTAVSVADFIAIKDNPAQRDTARRAATAKHLFAFDPHHLQVSVGMMPNGDFVKLDGHTRAYLWERDGTTGLPDNMRVNADVYAVADDAALVSLYDKIDAKFAVDTAQDAIYGAVKLLGAEFKSSMMVNLQFNAALGRLFRICARRQSPEEKKRLAEMVAAGKRLPDTEDETYRLRMREMPNFAPLLQRYANYASPENLRELVSFFKEELVLFDETMPNKRNYVTAITVAALITFMRHPDDAFKFWSAYNQNAGIKHGKQCDGVEAVKNIAADIRKKTNAKEVGDSEYVRRVINAFENWRLDDGGFGYTGVPRPIGESTLREYIEAGLRAKFQARDKWLIFKKPL